MDIQALFNPRSVAVIGADNDPKKVGYALMKNILASDTVREVYPVTLGHAEVLGRAAHTSVRAIGGHVDLAVIAVRADFVAGVLRECGEKGVKAAIVISAGFKEMGEDGKHKEEELAAIAREHDMALLGPNCLGIMDAHADWNASFAVGKPKKGGIAFVSQSGALGTALLDWANREGVGFSKFVSLGNEAALTESDFLEYAAHDDATRVVLLYVEQVRDGARFLAAVRQVTQTKPLVVLRAGRSARGSAAVASHTGSLAPSDKVFDAALRQAGALPVDSLRTLFALAKLFELSASPAGEWQNIARLGNLAILTNGGGPSVNTADLIDLSPSLSLATFSDETTSALRAVLPPMAAVGNPIDVIGDAGPDRYDNALRILTALPDVDAIITLVTPQMMTDPVGIAEVLVAHASQKPIIPVLMGGDAVAGGVRVLHDHAVVNFDNPADVVDALEALASHIVKQKGADKPAAAAAPRLSTHLAMLSYYEMRSMLLSRALSLEGYYITSQDELGTALAALGDGPYVIKAISRELVHKSDLRAVELGLANADALREAWGRITSYVESHTPGAHIEGMLIQRMVKGVECIIGMKRDAVFGPTIVFGLGGIFVEILKDTAMRVAPVSHEDALAQIREIKGLPLLTGARGRTPVHLDALADVIVHLSELAVAHPEVEEVDFNPVFATPDGAHIVDARTMVRERE